MTVKELIAKLEDMDEDLPVHIAYNYGDYWRTTVAPAAEKVRYAEATWSGYHSMHAIGRENSPRPEDVIEIVVIE